MLHVSLLGVGAERFSDDIERLPRAAHASRRSIYLAFSFFVGSLGGVSVTWVVRSSSDHGSTEVTHVSSEVPLSSRTTPFLNTSNALFAGEVDIDSHHLRSIVQLSQSSGILHEIRKFYFSVVDSTILHHCDKMGIQKACCKQISHVIGKMRFSIYLSLLTAFFCGILVPWSAYWLGMRMKPRRPAYWSEKACCGFNFKDNFFNEVDVTTDLLSPIQELMDLTTDSSRMGKGMDGAWVKHRKFRVVKVTRIENGRVWTAYKSGLRAIRKVSESMKKMPPANSAITKGANELLARTKRKWSSKPAVRKFLESLCLDESRNETLLFHGSPGVGARDVRTGDVKFDVGSTSPQEAIQTAGFDERVGSTEGMLGSGLYFADMASKADQYGGKYGKPDETTVGEEASMFLARVVLGSPYLSKDSLEQMRRPPCICGHFDWNLAFNTKVKYGKPWAEKGVSLELCEHPRYDSVISDLRIDGSVKLYHEYAVYGRQCYPEFRVTYVREAGHHS
eukprot:TRINITY_DN4581_c0_g2_i1.p1 TRINITY_DN4581_c0_g2~~TRINITY_DN4581_c0_g2_i1.p1  ORF type:complete len:506 (-),score=52.50 TRINITY_DN4581_c0_g2_i1:72-1589(-)